MLSPIEGRRSAPFIWHWKVIPSIDGEYNAQNREQSEAEHKHDNRGAAGKARVDVGEPTVLADFTTGADGFHHGNIFPHATRAMTDFFHALTQTQACIIVSQRLWVVREVIWLDSSFYGHEEHRCVSKVRLQRRERKPARRHERHVGWPDLSL